MTTKFAAYKESYDANPDAFLEGVVSFCKYASGEYEEKGILRRILPWVLAIGGLYAATKIGEGWGRYAQKTDNPAGPFKGAIGEVLGAMMPKGEKLVWPGSKEYEDAVDLRRAQDDFTWNRLHNNSVANGTAKSLTMRDHG